ncbi:AmmeMemoRadiSam system protein B [Candidatus Woesearchaeota archaeon]|jgi:MEMO1 family protein|nr:AmmeMemoRadiSam system protein B [Candidatus Woesearchaeota archaeon]
MIRKPYVAEQFYSDDFAELNDQVKNCFIKKNGPGEFSLNTRSKNIKAVIVPHAGYAYSGPCAAWAFKELGETKFPDTIIILGVNHSNNLTCCSDLDWETPFGMVKPDSEFIQKLSEENIPIENQDHEFEHSIEVQLPFLQFISKDYLKKLRIAPILIGDSNVSEIASKIFAAITSLNSNLKENRNFLIIVSSDFTHYGRNYRYIPFETGIKERVKEFDMNYIEAIKKMDSNLFLSEVNKKMGTVCGQFAIATMMELLQKLNPNQKINVSLLQYYSSGDIIGDFKNSVSYAALKFE